jgi:hypothetical protein
VIRRSCYAGSRQGAQRSSVAAVAGAEEQRDIASHALSLTLRLAVVVAGMSWALDEFFTGIEEEFGVPIGEADDAYLETPGAVIDFIVDNSEPTDGMTPDEYRDHVAGVVGEIMARTLGVTRYSEGSRFVEDLRVR